MMINTKQKTISKMLEKRFNFHDPREKPTNSKPESSRVYRPSIHLNTSQLPELKDVKFGDEFMLLCKVKVQSMVKRDNNSPSFDLDIMKVAVQK